MIFYYILITFILSILIIYIGSTVSSYTDNKNVKMVINWFSLLAILNIMIMMFILASYNTIRFKPGTIGPPGERGVIGYRGKDGSCAMCQPAINGLKPIRPLNKIDRIDAMDEDDQNKQLFTRDDNITVRDNLVHRYLNDIYIKTFEFVNKLAYKLGLSYQIRKGFAKFYGLKISNEIKKNREKYTIAQIRYLSQNISSLLDSRKGDIENQIHQIKIKTINDQQKYIEQMVNRQTYGHDV